ncbi:MAG: DUF4258 domain-containing protein [Armatimonadetes bacterium]|nr:DUF4258 domain-containing protein [Armatimonadota bacterium]HOC30755.1 DUF4258 domain-containing protein [Armatimonadota bacterium]
MGTSRKPNLVFRVHAIRRMFERRIRVSDVEEALRCGETIEEYPDDTPCPSHLVMGWISSRPLHIVVAENTDNSEKIVVTVYDPDPDLWSDDYRRRLS